MGKFTRHLALGEKLIVDGEEFILKPLPIDYLPDFFEAMKAMSGAVKASKKEGAEPDISEILGYLNKEGSQSIGRLIDKTLEISFPAENEEERKAFALRYFAELLEKVFEINSAATKNPEIQAKLKALQKQKNESAKQAES